MLYPFHYSVAAKLKILDEKILEFEVQMIESEPILSREKAFRHYQNYIDVLIDSTGKRYNSDSQARGIIRDFLGSQEESEFGIGIFIVIDTPIHGYDLKCGDIYMIHGIGRVLGCSDYSSHMLLGLQIEHDYYEEYGYRKLNLLTRIFYCDQDEWEAGYRNDEPAEYAILRTPYSWIGMDKAYWWEEYYTSD
jgi:hypothetical protein